MACINQAEELHARGYGVDLDIGVARGYYSDPVLAYQHAVEALVLESSCCTVVTRQQALFHAVGFVGGAALQPHAVA